MGYYIYFADPSKLLGLPCMPHTFSDGVTVYVHRVLGDANLNWSREYSQEEVEAEKQRIISLGMPSDEFFTYERLMTRLQAYEEAL